MNQIATAAAVVALVYAATDFLRYAAARQRAQRAPPDALQTWEDEGGAVLVTRSRTAAQVAPHPGRTGIADSARG